MQEEMELAREVVQKTRRRQELELELKQVKDSLSDLQQRLLDAIEEGRYPAKSQVDGMSIFVRRTVWARPKERGDEGKEAAVMALRACGLDDYVQDTFNTHSISAYVRDVEKEGEVLPPEFLDAFRIDETFELQAR